MSTHKYIDRICVVAVIIALLITAVFMNGESLGIQVADRTMGYENRLFDTANVHTIDIVMDDWDSFIETCENEEYAACSVVIDGEAYKNVGIRAKGNTSLSTVSSMDSDRYSFKIEFDQYDSTKSYYGLDKLSLNNIIQDTTYMKDYLTYQMMASFGVDAPLCSYVYITVNGEDWGLYLAVEGIEDAFLQRNYGSDYGELYKPDSMSFGGGRGNGKSFDMEDFMSSDNEETTENNSDSSDSGSDGGMDVDGSDNNAAADNFVMPDAGNMQMPEGMEIPEGVEMPEGMQMPEGVEMPEGMEIPEGVETPEGMEIPEGVEMPEGVEIPEGMQIPEGMGNGGGNMAGGGMGSSDVKLQYIDDDPESYSNIFNNAKTDITEADQTRLIESLESLSEGTDIEDVVNIDEVIRYFVVHNFVCNGDSYTGSMIHNYYLYEEDGQLSMIPWDYNLAFGTFQGGNATSTVNSPIDTPVSGSSDDRPMVDWIFDNETYTERYHQYFAEFLESMDFETIIDDTSALIAPYVEKDPTKFYSYEEFETGVATLKEFCLLRRQSVEGQLDGTIPSTTDGQNADNSALIDASHITLSDMGSMGGSMGGMAGGFSGGSFTDFGGKMPGDSNDGAAEDAQISQPESAAETETEMETVDSEANDAGADDAVLNGGDAAMPQMPGGMTVPDSSQMPGDMQMPGGSQMTGDMQMPDGSQMTGNMQMPGDNQMAGDMMASANSGIRMENIVVLAVSAAILVLGLIFAFIYKRRK